MIRALILAAGQGTRLRPLTDHRPKCLVPLAGKSLLQRQIDTLEKCGIRNIHVVAGYCAQQIQALGIPVSINSAYASTNMVESLFAALSFIQQPGDLVIAYGDIVYQRDNLQNLLLSNDEIALMIDLKWRDLWTLRLENPLDDAETLLIDERGYVSELGQKPDSYAQIQGQYTGLIKVRDNKREELMAFYNSLDRTAIYDGKDFNNMYMTSFLQLLIDAGWQTKAITVENGWLEIDSVEDLEVYENMAEQGSLRKLYDFDLC